MRLSGFFPAALALSGAIGCLPLAAQNIISAKSGLIHYAEGDVRIGDQSAAPNNSVFQSLAVGQELTTGEGRAEMLLGPGQFVRVNENSSIRMVSNKLDSTRLEVVRGSAMIELVDMAKNAPVNIDLGANRIELRKYGLYRVDADPSRIRVYDGEATATGNGQTLTAKKGKEISLGAVYAESGFDPATGDEFSRWAERRAGYIATANVSAARDSFSTSGQPNNWAFNQWYGMYTYVPNNQMFMSPYGYYYFTPDFASNGMFWPYLGCGYGMYGVGGGYGFGGMMNFNPACAGYGNYFGYPGYSGVGYPAGSYYGTQPVRPPGPLFPRRPVSGNPGVPVTSRLTMGGSGPRGFGSSIPRGSSAGPVRGTGSYYGGYSSGMGNGGGGYSSARSGGISSPSTNSVPMSGGGSPVSSGGGGGRATK